MRARGTVWKSEALWNAAFPWFYIVQDRDDPDREPFDYGSCSTWQGAMDGVAYGFEIAKEGSHG